MKSIVGFVAIVFVAVVAYMLAQSGKSTPQKVTQTIETEAAKPQKVEEENIFQSKEEEQVVPQKKKEDSIAKKVATKQPEKKVVSHTLVKKEKLVTDTNVTSSKLLSDTQSTSDEPLSNKEWEDIEKQMIASGQISQKDDLHASTKNLGYDPSELAEDVQYSAKPTSNEPLSEKEWEDVEKQMIESGQIRQEDDLSSSTKNYLGYDPSEIAEGI